MLERIKNTIREKETSVESVSFIIVFKCALPIVGPLLGEGMMWLVAGIELLFFWVLCGDWCLWNFSSDLFHFFQSTKNQDCHLRINMGEEKREGE